MPANERILPGLLDRLTAAAPQAQGARSSAAATLKNYQQSVMRDLGWLLNAKAGLDEDVAKDFPEVGRSVLNFGTRDFCGVTASSVNVGEVERELKEAIQLYEPRIISSTLSVKVVPSREKSGVNLLSFEIRAEVWAVPFPEQVFIRTELDLETGQYLIR